MTILTHEEHRELDYQIATKLGFFTIVKGCRAIDIKFGESIKRITGYNSRKDWEEYIRALCDRFSSDPAKNMLVIDEMISRGYSFSLEYDRGHTSSFWALFFDHNGGIGDWHPVINDDKLIAICGAALEAVKHPIKEEK